MREKWVNRIIFSYYKKLLVLSVRNNKKGYDKNFRKDRSWNKSL